MDDLELYPRANPLRAARKGLRTLRANWRRVLAWTVAMLLLFGFAGYQWATTVTPVDSAQAVELFRAEKDVTADDSSEKRAARSERPTGSAARDSGGRAERRPGVASVSRPVRRERDAGKAEGRREPSSSRTQTTRRFTPPDEGVYSWATDGYEQVSGARREFPRETQRILTYDSKGRWTEHHYFSEERESWTSFHWGSRGAEIEQQRNKVTFGPITNNSSIDFDPPMLVGPRDLEVGYRWGDTWRGDTSGDYSSEIFEHTTLEIGGESVEVWGISYEINLRGSQEGRVLAEVWLAPDHGIVVKEHYKQDIESSGARYQAEWTQTLKSLEPRQ